MQRLILFLQFVLLFGGPRLQAQTEPAGVSAYLQNTLPGRKMLLTAGFQTAIPMGSFASDVPKAGYGVNLQFGYRSAHWPIELLGSADMLLYGYQSSSKTLGPGQPQGYEVVVDRFQYMIPLHVHLRYAPEFGNISPFAEIFGGMRLIASRTRALGNVLISSPNNPEAFSARADYYDFTSSFGLGAGLSYQLADFGNVRYKCSLSSRWMRGGKANYLSTDDIQLNGNTLIYEPRFKETNLLLLQLGFTALF